ncbi:MAG: hypothetical protein V2A72_00970 [Candidatus Omnitrophota bacterium]
MLHKNIARGVLLFLMLSMFIPVNAIAENRTFQITAFNPSPDKTQAASIKKYLPSEVKPENIVDNGGLDIEYDAETSRYFVYKKDLELKPRETKTFTVETQDVWLVPENKLSDIGERVDIILRQLEETEYYIKAKEIADTIYPRLNEIRVTQADDAASNQSHIGIYRQNLTIVSQIEADATRLEKILVTAGGPPAPEMLADTKIVSDAPSKTMTWIVIFVIILFTGLLAAVLFFTWQRQAKVTKDTLVASKQAAFPEAEQAKPEEGEGKKQE